MHKFQAKKYLIVLAVIGLLIFLHILKILAPVETACNHLFSSAFTSFYSTGSVVRQTYDSQDSKKSLLNKIEKLGKRNKELVVEQIKLKNLEEENRLLRQNLKFQTENDYKYITAKVISRSDQTDLSAHNQLLIVNKGEKDGVKVGQIVISPYDSIEIQGVVIGKVMQTKENISKIFLLTSPSCELAVSLWGDNKTSGIAKGDFGLTIEVDYIPQTKEISIGDIVTTSGLEEKIPGGLAVGEITAVVKESNQLWQKASISPLVDLDNLVILSILVE